LGDGRRIQRTHPEIEQAGLILRLGEKRGEGVAPETCGLVLDFVNPAPNRSHLVGDAGSPIDVSFQIERAAFEIGDAALDVTGLGVGNIPL